MEEEVGVAAPWAVTTGDWLDGLSTAAMARAGDVVLALLIDAHRWIHRRVERVQFWDERSARHRVSLDFTLPLDTPPVAQFHGAPIYIAPLFFLPKDHPSPTEVEGRSVLPVYSSLDLVDEAGKSVPLVSRAQGSTIAAAALVARARQVLGPNLGELQDPITRIAVSDSLYNRWPALHNVMEDLCSDQDARKQLRKDRIFSELAYAFASHWLVVHPFICPDQHPPKRSIIKLAYNKTTQPERGSLEVELRKGLGWTSTVFWIRLTQIGAAASYHLEIAAPPELEMTEVGLFGRRYKLGWQGLSSKSSQMRRPDAHNYYVRQPDRTSEGHIYLPGGPNRRIGAAWVKLRARRSGFLIGALISTCIISLILFVYAGNADDIIRATAPGGSSAAVTVLLLLPTVLAAYIARPGEHAITGRMLRILRLALAADGGLPFVAAIVLLRTPARPLPHQLANLTSWLNWLARGSLIFVAIFLISTVLPRPHGTWEYSLGDEGEPLEAVKGRRGIIFGRILPATRANEAYINTLRKWRRDRGRFLPVAKPDESYITTLRKWVAGREEDPRDED